jgi:hypothetical protein
MKQEVEKMIEEAYGLVGLSIEAKKECIASLLDGKDAYADDVSRSPWQYNHPIAKSVIQALLFKTPMSIGNLYPMGFGPPITLQILALTFMVIRCCLDQLLESGEKSTILMDKKRYEDIFFKHLFNIQILHADEQGGPALCDYLHELHASSGDAKTAESSVMSFFCSL